MRKRRISKAISVGGVTVGGGAPVVVQSMTKTDMRDVAATVRQIRELEECGCELVRLAVPDAEAAKALRSIKRRAKVPLIADIHFDYRLALAALEAGVDGLRLNPGNISDPEQIAAVVKSARSRKVPIRIGVNAGSLPKKPARGSVAQRMVKAALAQMNLLESLDFDLIKISLKAFDVRGLPTDGAENSLSAALGHHRGWPAEGRRDPQRGGHWDTAARGDWRHHPRLAHRRSQGRSAGRL
jgi:(E)-4-hydroxy-3-methylbut-2-enyl-diphosphate synthase